MTTGAWVSRTASARRTTALIWFGVILVAALPVALIFAGLHVRGQVSPIKGGRQAAGTIVDVTSAEALHGRTYTPTIVFTDSTGHVHLFDGPSDATSQRVGTRVTVSYDPADPDHAADVSAGARTWEVTFWAGVGLAVAEVVVAGVVAKRIVVRRRASPT
jgi:hypothetical protein